MQEQEEAPCAQDAPWPGAMEGPRQRCGGGEEWAAADPPAPGGRVGVSAPPPPPPPSCAPARRCRCWCRAPSPRRSRRAHRTPASVLVFLRIPDGLLSLWLLYLTYLMRFLFQ